MKKLKPVVFVQGDKHFYRENKYAQNIILKALSEGVTDVNELRKITGMKTAADVYRTLDKLAIRKEYHKALGENGISLEYITNGIKDIADKGDKDSVRLKAFQMLLRSIGLERYENEEDSGKNWEETIISAFEKNDGTLGENAVPKLEEIESDYEVVVPETPESVKKKKEEERELAKELYGN